MIQEVATALKQLNQEVVFVGGSTVALYLDPETSTDIRPTDDVDLIIEVLTAAKYSALSEKLMKLRFTPDRKINAPICRWKYLGITVDIMPLDESILGFSNKYYKTGFLYKEEFVLPNGEKIFILPFAYFLATKLEAYFNRGVNDPRFSKDLEDIVTLLSDVKDFQTIFSHEEILENLRSLLKSLLDDEKAIEAMRAFMQNSIPGQFDILVERAKLIK